MSERHSTFPIARSITDDINPDAVGFGDGFVAVWASDNQSETSIRAARLTRDGEVLDSDGFRVAGGLNPNIVIRPSVASVGATVAVTWKDYDADKMMVQLYYDTSRSAMIESIDYSQAGGSSFRVSGATGSSLSIESSTDLQSWSEWTSYPDFSGEETVVDSSTQDGHRFCRARAEHL